MRHAGLLFLTLLIFITIFFNLFINASSNIVEIIMFPGNYLFSRLYSKIESRSVSEEILNSVLQSVQRNPFFIVEDKNVEDKGIGIYYGIILRETNRNFTVLTRDNNIDENYLVVNEEGILLGFVEKVYSNNILVRKIGWGNQILFGRVENLDVLIKENHGDLLVEIPDNYILSQDNLKLLLDLPFYISEESSKNTFLIGDLVSKYGEFYLFKPFRNQSYLVYIFPY
ncbi:hypothetical protein [Defluviitoga tunisiensis]|jgi:hypothetical protein|uniref:hypothetical protein n=1 Tax=Defluviitoga tunisiensis TaxID=1006576 RepID=UPI00118506FB|nr:hypothetical protein [Defluviitoga tunisiensis]